MRSMPTCRKSDANVPDGKSGRARCRAALFFLRILSCLRVAAAAFLVALLVVVTGCDNARAETSIEAACRSVGICDEPPAPAVYIDILCDASAGSTCNKSALNKTLERSLRSASERPGTTVRLWLLGKDVSTTVVVGEQTAPAAPSATERSRHARADRFVAAAKDYLLATATPALEAPPIRRSPLFEAISKVALADAGGLPRHLVVITDAREVGAFDFECAKAPPDAVLLAALRRQHLLDPGLLAGVSVEFAFVTFGPIPGRGCVVNVERQLRLTELWTLALKTSSAASVRISSGPPSFEAARPSSEPAPANTASNEGRP